MKTLHTFYDMAVSPCSFDFFGFLMSAEVSRVRRNLENIHLHIIRGPKNSFRDDEIRTDEQNLNHFLNVILPGISLLPSIEKFDWIDRNETSVEKINAFNIFPRGYSLRAPIADYVGHELVASKLRGENPQTFTAPAYAQKLASSFLRGFESPKVITITARELNREDINHSRKLTQEVWMQAIELLLQHDYHVVIIRDTEKSMSNEPLFEGTTECPAASIHLPFRLALYEQSLRNLVKATGPGFLQYFSKSFTSMFLSNDEDVVSYSKNFYHNNFGMPEQSAYPMTQTNISFVWNDETPERILRETKKGNSNVPKPHEFYSQDNLLLSLKITINKFMRDLSFGVIFPEDLTTIETINRYLKKNNSPKTETIEEIILANEGGILKKGTMSAIEKMKSTIQN